MPVGRVFVGLSGVEGRPAYRVHTCPERTGAQVLMFLDAKTGAYAGATSELGAGASCGFCVEPAVSDGSNLRIETGHVHGTVKVAHAASTTAAKAWDSMSRSTCRWS